MEQNKFRVQPSAADRETSSTLQLSNKQIDLQNKRPPSVKASQMQLGRNSRGSPKACRSKGSPKESCLSSEAQSEGHNIRQGL